MARVRGRHLTEDERLELARAIAEGAGTRTAAAVAREFGCDPGTAQKLRADMVRAGFEAMKAGRAMPDRQPIDRHDADFWRRRAQKQAREIGEMQRLVSELGGLDGITIRAPEWAWKPRTGGPGRATLIVHNSDRHYGEVIQPTEINGWNRYDPDVCARRVKRFMDAACEIGRRWTAGTTVDGVLYTMGGDEISGDIHDELRETNALTSLEQVEGAAALHVACLRQLLEEYGQVHVMAVPGNHGRTTRKPTAKKYGALSYDTMIARLVAKDFAEDERVSFQIAEGSDAMMPVYNRPLLVTHGDKIGTGGGKGFAGPVLPIIRGNKQVQLQYGSMGMAPYLTLMGHYHTSAQPPGILANGSVAGYSEFGFGIRGSVDVPRQWLAVISDRWGLKERLDVALEEPPAPEKPRVRLSQTAA